MLFRSNGKRRAWSTASRHGARWHGPCAVALLPLVKSFSHHGRLQAVFGEMIAIIRPSEVCNRYDFTGMPFRDPAFLNVVLTSRRCGTAMRGGRRDCRDSHHRDSWRMRNAPRPVPERRDACTQPYRPQCVPRPKPICDHCLRWRIAGACQDRKSTV